MRQFASRTNSLLWLVIMSAMALAMLPPTLCRLPHVSNDSAEWVMIPDTNFHMHSVNVNDSRMKRVPSNDLLRSSVFFELYTPDNPHVPQILRSGDQSALRRSNFNGERPTRFVLHGWNTDGSITSTFQNAYFDNDQHPRQQHHRHHDINLIAVNWQIIANTFNYIQARRSVDVVADMVASFVEFLVRRGDARLGDIHLIGHSLGAHVAGIAGKRITIGKLPLIVALDPAWPLFHLNRPHERIATGDAFNVHIVHTTAGRLGITAPIGDASFYPNGGRVQPGCGWDWTASCGHRRAFALFAESIYTAVGFHSAPCGSLEEMWNGDCKNKAADVDVDENGGGDRLVRMGDDLDVRGIFYLVTKKTSPYALGLHGV